MQDIIRLEVVRLHPQGRVLGLYHPGSHLDDHTVSQRAEFLVDGGADLAENRRREFLDQGKDIRSGRDIGHHRGNVRAKHLTKGLRRGRVGQGLFDTRDRQQRLPHDWVQLVDLGLVDLVEHINRLLRQVGILFYIGGIIGGHLVHQGVIAHDGGLVLCTHEDHQPVHFALADGLRYRVNDAALLDAIVDNVRHVVR